MVCLASSITNLTTDQSALFALRAQITYDPEDVLANNWSTTTSVCNWIGVSCGLKHQRVTALNVSLMGLEGTIAPHLGNLSFLASLDMSYNNLNGYIPEELAHLNRLNEINLEFNNLSGEIPSWFEILPKLNKLVLSQNSFTGSIPKSLCNISKLAMLDISNNSLHGNIPQEIGNLSKLEVLYLYINELTGDIPREISNLTMLVKLYLGGNNFKGVIPLEIGNLQHLEVLRFQNGSLTGLIPSSIFNISFLQVLDLTSNQLTGQIPSGLWRCTGLQILFLHDNKFTGSISKKIGNLTSLVQLYLGRNNLTGSLPNEIGNLNLDRLSVQRNTLTGTIPFKIFNVSTMTFLDLSFNHFSGSLPSKMGFWLPNLEKLYLSFNKLSGTIPSSISNASRLTVIELANNSLTGCIPNTLGSLTLLQELFLGTNYLTRESSTSELRFFSSLTNCKQLEILVIADNPLNGILPISFGNLSRKLLIFQAYGCKIKCNIPIGIGNLSNLYFIDLQINQLTGPIPKTMERLQNLQVLYLQSNRLQGYIPDYFCRLRKLGDLFVSDNKLYGPIPTCLGGLKSLRKLYLDSNKLTSTIPSNLWSLKDLLAINLSSNFLRGHLPLDIGNLKVITVIDLSWNQLSGTIPSTIGGAQSLVNLSLAHNKMEGPISQSLGNLISLELLDLSSNNFSGVIPKSLETLRYLQFFNVSFNRLQGEIPTGGHFANFTANSFSHNDALCGAPRLQVPPCKTNKKRRLGILEYILPPIAIVILVVLLIFLWMGRRKQKIKLQTQADWSPFAWRRVSFDELVQATEAFSETNLIGMGSYGSVFKGTLLDGLTIAVKVFNVQVEGALKSFDVECEAIRNIRHRNLIKIISSCTNLDFKALVLEYMPNGSLDKWLFSHNYCLDILQRLNIMIDVASALEYLHHGHTTPIVHCDLKPSNVLLDEDMVAHVADFGIAKLLSEGDLMVQTMTLATIGYMAPEYGTGGIVSTRGDVYSYGVLLMETFTGKKPTEEMFVGEMSLKRWVNEALMDGSIVTIVDSNLMGREEKKFSVKEQCVSSILGLAMECSNDLPEKRITMEEASVKLKKINVSLLGNIGRT